MFVLGTYPTRLHHHDLSTVTPWSGVTECLDPSTIWPTGQESWRFLFLRKQGVVISTYYTYWYTSDTSILFYLTRNTCKFLQYFSNFSLVYKIFSQSRDCPVHVYLCLQYITHLSYKDIIMSNPFSQFWNLIFMPPTPIPKPNSNFKLIGILFILESFCTDRNFFLDMYYLIKKILNGWLAYKSKKKKPNKQM